MQPSGVPMGDPFLALAPNFGSEATGRKNPDTMSLKAIHSRSRSLRTFVLRCR